MTNTHRKPALMALSAVLGAVLAASPAALAAHQEEESPAQTPDARQLFLDNCASCHGETGDGQGVTELDRPARSFKDGGFSYGNTPVALFRTISVGIPGTPMPATPVKLLSDKQVWELVAYVRKLQGKIK